MDELFTLLRVVDSLLWQYISLFIILSIGLYFTIRSKFYQLSVLIRPKKYIGELLSCAEKNKQGIDPIKLYFSSVGGMVGLGNLVMVVSVITIGGLGGVFWMWIGSFLGMIVKYSEIYLGIKYRIKNSTGGYDGGPMYFLQVAFKNNRFNLDKILPVIVSILLCIYGAEVSQFLVLTDTFSSSIFKINRYVVIGTLLILVIISVIGGVKRLSNICSMLMPPFMISYIILGLWIIIDHYHDLPEIFRMIVDEAFSIKGSISGMIGSQVLTAAHYGMSQAVYSGDIGIGYDSITQSETQTIYPERQARLAIFALFSDTIICTMTVLIILLTNNFRLESIKKSEYIINAISQYLPFSDYYIAFIFFIAAFTTVIGYLVVGLKAAHFLSIKIGRKLYLLYAMIAFIIFSFQDQSDVMLIMSVASGLLMPINLSGVFILRKEIQFKK
jgi:AGCS family alanine or glycine:cation symporter